MEGSLYEDGEKSLFHAVIYQAYHDALSDSIIHRSTALAFIKGINPNYRWLFNFYATHIGYDADWLRSRLLKSIERAKGKKLLFNKLREAEVE